MRTEWLVIFLVSGAGTLLGGVLINMVPAGRPRPNVIPTVVGEPRVVVEARDADSQLRDLRSLQMARLSANRDSAGTRRPTPRSAPSTAAPVHEPLSDAQAVTHVPRSSSGQWLSEPPTRVESRRPAPEPRRQTRKQPPSREPETASPPRTPVHTRSRSVELASAPATPAEAPARVVIPVEEPAVRRAEPQVAQPPVTARQTTTTAVSETSQTAQPVEGEPAPAMITIRPPPTAPAEPVPRRAVDPAALPVGEWQELSDDEQALPTYRILHRTSEYRSERVFAEVYVPGLRPDMDKREIKRVAKAIAEVESIDSMTLYCTLEARRADYSMDYADAHPEALAEGLLGRWERGWFKPYKR